MGKPKAFLLGNSIGHLMRSQNACSGPSQVFQAMQQTSMSGGERAVAAGAQKSCQFAKDLRRLAGTPDCP